MYRGRYQLGDTLPLGVLVRDGTGLPALPDAVPLCEVYGPDGKVLTGRAIPVLGPFAATGLFQGGLFLGPLFDVGAYAVAYRWATGAGAFLGGDLDTFEIVSGGDVKGNQIALHYVARPFGNFVLQHLDSGRLRKNRNPRL